MYYQQPQPQQPKKNSPFLWVGIGCAGLLIACIGCAAFGGLVGGGTSSIVNAAW